MFRWALDAFPPVQQRIRLGLLAVSVDSKHVHVLFPRVDEDGCASGLRYQCAARDQQLLENFLEHLAFCHTLRHRRKFSVHLLERTPASTPPSPNNNLSTHTAFMRAPGAKDFVLFSAEMWFAVCPEQQLSAIRVHFRAHLSLIRGLEVLPLTSCRWNVISEESSASQVPRSRLWTSHVISCSPFTSLLFRRKGGHIRLLSQYFWELEARQRDQRQILTTKCREIVVL